MNIQLDSLSTLVFTIICLLIGMTLKNKSLFLNKFCIPESVIGGFLVSIIIWLAKSYDIAYVKFDTNLQGFLMVAFFTTVGIEGSFKILKSGSKLLMIYLSICWFLAFFQNTFGLGLAILLGIDPVIGVMAGAVSLTGGHGGAAAFGGMAEALGHQSASVAAIAAATFGLITGSLLGGPVARYIIKRHNVKIEAISDEKVNYTGLTDTVKEINVNAFIKMLAVILGIMAVGRWASEQFTTATGFSLPSYVGAMIIAILIRNLNDSFKIIDINKKSIDLISGVSLGLFLTMAMMSLKIWELKNIAIPLLIILVFQVFVLLIFTVFFVFRFLGKNYDAAVMCAGLLGHGLGATPNAMANMTSVNEHYKVISTRALMIVPLSGAVLIDIVAIPYHTWLINFFS